MKRWMLIVAPVFAATLTFAASQSLLVKTPPQASISPEHQSVNATDGVESLVATYQIKNQGGKDLLLGEFKTSCGCSSASVEPKILQPGQSGEIRVVGEPPASGEKEVTISLSSNAHPNGEIKLGLTLVGPARRVPFIRVDSGPVQFGHIRLGFAEKIFFETTERSGEGHWIESSSSTFEGLAIKLNAVDEQKVPGQGLYRRYQYEASFTKMPPIGKFRGEILFVSTFGGELEIHRLPVFGDVPEPILAVPSSIYASVIPGESVPLLTIQLKAEDTSFPLTSECTIEGSTALTVSLKEASPGSLFYELSPTSPMKETTRATAIFRTNHPDLAQVRVPVTIFVASP